MLALGQKLAGPLGAGDSVLLRGGLGAGKTTLARGIVQALTGESEVPSPTYTLVQTYEGVEAEVWHADLYRLDLPEDIHPLGLLDVADEVISLIEWPDRLGSDAPTDAMTLTLAIDRETARRLTLRGPRNDLARLAPAFARWSRNVA